MISLTFNRDGGPYAVAIFDPRASRTARGRATRRAT